jgi:hypothetical protein
MLITLKLIIEIKKLKFISPFSMVLTLDENDLKKIKYNV